QTSALAAPVRKGFAVRRTARSRERDRCRVIARSDLQAASRSDYEKRMGECHARRQIDLGSQRICLAPKALPQLLAWGKSPQASNSPSSKALKARDEICYEGNASRKDCFGAT